MQDPILWIKGFNKFVIKKSKYTKGSLRKKDSRLSSIFSFFVNWTESPRTGRVTGDSSWTVGRSDGSSGKENSESAPVLCFSLTEDK